MKYYVPQTFNVYKCEYRVGECCTRIGDNKCDFDYCSQSCNTFCVIKELSYYCFDFNGNDMFILAHSIDEALEINDTFYDSRGIYEKRFPLSNYTLEIKAVDYD